MDSVQLNNTYNFEANALKVRNEKEVVVVIDRFSNMQPSSRSCVDRSILGKKLDVCVTYDLYEGITELSWYQEEEVLVSNGSNTVKPGATISLFKSEDAVIMKWDTNVSCGEEGSESAQWILTSRQKPKINHNDGSWLLD